MIINHWKTDLYNSSDKQDFSHSKGGVLQLFSWQGHYLIITSSHFEIANPNSHCQCLSSCLKISIIIDQMKENKCFWGQVEKPKYFLGILNYPAINSCQTHTLQLCTWPGGFGISPSSKCRCIVPIKHLRLHKVRS